MPIFLHFFLSLFLLINWVLIINTTKLNIEGMIPITKLSTHLFDLSLPF
jgi:hypothetical protein